MTVTTTANRIDYVGDGIVTVFAFNFLVYDAGHLLVYLDGVLTSTGFVTTLDIDNSNGFVTFDVAPAVAVEITLLRDVPLTQLIDYTPYDPFPAETHERGLDLGVMRDQQVVEFNDRALRVPIEDPPINDIPNVAGRAGRLLGFDAEGQPVPGSLLDDIVTKLDDLLDVDVSTVPPVETDALIFNATKGLFENKLPILSLDDLTSVTAPTPNENEVLKFVGGQWINAELPASLVFVGDFDPVTGVPALDNTPTPVGTTAGETYIATDSGLYNFTTGLPGSGVQVNINDQVAWAAAQGSWVVLATGSTLASEVNYDNAASGLDAANVQDAIDEVAASHISVKDFGAIGDGIADDTLALQAALDHIATLGGTGGTSKRRAGGTLFFPNGTYKTTAELTLNPGVYNLEGTGRSKVYPDLFVPESNGLPTIMPVHTDRNCFLISPGTEEVSLRMHNLNMATLQAGDIPTAAIGWDMQGSRFQRDYTFDRVGIFGFQSAFDVYATVSGVDAVGIINIIDCAVNRNVWIMRCLDDTAINGLRVMRNEMGQNNFGFDIKGQAMSIHDNILEGLGDAIQVIGNYRGLTIKGNYFENMVGDFIINIQSVIGPVVESNYVLNSTAIEDLKVSFASDARIHETDMVPSPSGAWNLRTLDGAFTPVPLGAGSMSVYYDESLRSGITADGVTEFGALPHAGTGIHRNISGSGGTLLTTVASGLTSYTRSGYNFPTGTWIGVGYVVTYDSEPAIAPRLELRVNSTNTDGHHAAVFHEWNEGPRPTKDQTVVYFAMVKATQIVTSFQLFAYPYGLNSGAGLTVIASAPYFYDYGTSLDGLAGNVHPFVPGIQVDALP